ncbi:tetratricopeptide repeat protein [Asticcacaulis sp.]|uniref:tetratricopeptide repeat protein n=1 Tax=Asticcacaulis sp. TaxID=1872648 RepID=UPI0031DDF0EA
MRWAQQRGLPVKRIPGGKVGTVYALAEELDAWAASQGRLEDDPQTSAPEALVSEKRSAPAFSLKWALVGALALLAILAALTYGVLSFSSDKTSAALKLPADPALAQTYLDARDSWAQRTPQSLERAQTLLQTLTQKEPTFAPAWSALADVYLLRHEFGGLDEKSAFEKAEIAALEARRLDASLAAAHRAIGFVQYWWHDDPASAGKSFREALRLSPDDPQTHFWFGTLLSDNGQHVEAIRELKKARLLEPGSRAIQTEMAWAQWAAGNDTQARQDLGKLLEENATFALIYDCTSEVKLADGDYLGYVNDLTEFARLTEDQALMSHAQRLRTASKSGIQAVQTEMMAAAVSELKGGDRRKHVWAVFLASVAQDRDQTVSLLREATRRKESWGDAARTGRILRLWAGDAQITALVERLTARPDA